MSKKATTTTTTTTTTEKATPKPKAKPMTSKQKDAYIQSIRTHESNITAHYAKLATTFTKVKRHFDTNADLMAWADVNTSVPATMAVDLAKIGARPDLVAMLTMRMGIGVVRILSRCKVDEIKKGVESKAIHRNMTQAEALAFRGQKQSKGAAKGDVLKALENAINAVEKSKGEIDTDKLVDLSMRLATLVGELG